jgi:hypothetical protein
MSSFKLNGTIKKIGDTVQVTDKFKKREVVITDASSMYPQHVTMQFTQDKCDILNAYNEGQEVEISFNLDGKEYTDKNTGEIKYFNSLNAWKIESAAPSLASITSEAPSQPSPITDEDDSLPF